MLRIAAQLGSLAVFDVDQQRTGSPDSRARRRNGGFRAFFHLAHQAEYIVFRIVKETHPQVVSVHAGDQVRRAQYLHAVFLQHLEGGKDILHFKINDRAGMIELALRQRQHQPDAIAIEERHLVRNAEKEAHAELVAIKFGSSGYITSAHADLADL